jgi:hypothetical protein
MFGFFNKKAEKREVDALKMAVQTGFNSAKQDINNLGVWVKHLNSEDSKLKSDISELHEELASVKEELENLKNVVDLIGNRPVFKQRQTVFNKQTGVQGVLNSVQTGVQTGFLDNLSTTERAIILVLLNSDMKLSYEDLAAILGKNRATIRGQLNSIRQKSEGLIEEVTGENNKKRVYIPERAKEMLLKSRKVREKIKKKSEQEE